MVDQVFKRGRSVVLKIAGGCMSPSVFFILKGNFYIPPTDKFMLYSSNEYMSMFMYGINVGKYLRITGNGGEHHENSRFLL